MEKILEKEAVQIIMVKTKNIFISLCWIVLFLLFTRSYRIYYFYDIEWLNNLYTALSKVFVVFIGAIFLLTFFSKGFLNRSFFYCIALLYIFQILSTFIGDGSFHVLIVTIYPIIGMNCFLSLVCERQSQVKSFISVMSSFMLIMELLNLISMRMLPEGYSGGVAGTTYLIGIENQVSLAFLLGFLFCLLDWSYNRCLWKVLIYLILYCVSSIIIWSGSGVVAMATLLIGIFPICWNTLKKVDLFYLAIVAFFIIFLVVYLGVLKFFEKEPFNFIFKEILKKDPTFTGRIGLWETLLNQWKEKPLFGYGVQETVNQFVGNSLEPSIRYSAHNQFLQFLWEGGLCSFFCFILIIAKASRDLRKCKNEEVETTFKLVLLVLFVVLMSEAASFDSVFFLLGFAGNIGYARDDKYETLLLKNVQFSSSKGGKTL